MWAERELEFAWLDEMLPVRGAREEVLIGSSRSSRVAGDRCQLSCVVDFGMRDGIYLTIIGINQVVAFNAGVVVVFVGIGGA